MGDPATWSKHFHEGSVEPQVPRLPQISCREWGFDQLHVVLFKENHIVVAGKGCEVGNPGTLPRHAGAGGMTERGGLLKGDDRGQRTGRFTDPLTSLRGRKHFHERSVEPQVPPLRFAPVGMTREGRRCQEKVVAGLPFGISSPSIATVSLSSRPERRDLRFPGPFMEMFSTAYLSPGGGALWFPLLFGGCQPSFDGPF